MLLAHLRKLETFSIQGNPFQDPFDVWVERETKHLSAQDIESGSKKGEKESDGVEGKREKGEKEEKAKEESAEKEGVLVREEGHRQVSLRLLKKLRRVSDQWLSIYAAASRGDSIVIEDLLGEVFSFFPFSPFPFLSFPHISD